MKSIIVDNKKITPSKIICIGRNYVDHIAELGNEIPDEMVIFLKPNSAISSELNSFHQEQLHYEGELCFVYQKGIFSAVGFGLDLTKRSLQSVLKTKGLPWERAKAFNGAAVFSNFVLIDNIEQALRLELSINNKMVQTGDVGLMIYKPEHILKELQTFIDLEDGDIVMTGTPKGVGAIFAGDNYTGKVFMAKTELLSVTWIAQ